MSWHVPLQPGVDVLPAEPLMIHQESVRPEWIDYNGHMNVAYYVLAFDHAADALFDMLDIGQAYCRRSNRSVFVLESHVSYLQEVLEGDPLRFSVHLLDADEKRLHFFLEMHHGEKDYLAATLEQLALHVDLGARRAAPFPAEVHERIAMIRKAQRDLAPAAQVGRAVGIRRRPAA